MPHAAAARLPFEIRARAGQPDEAEIFIYGNIGDRWDDNGVTAAQFVRDLQNVDAKTINLRINSFGGAVPDGLAIYNALKRHPATVASFIDGVAMSIASLIAMAGDSVSMAENAMLMVHGPQAMAGGNATQLRQAADILDRFGAAMAPSYAAKSGKPVAQILPLLTDGEDHWYTAAEAKAFGFADDITAAIGVEASFDLARFRSLPAAAAAFSLERTAPMPNTTPAAAATPAPADPQAQAAATAATAAAAAAAQQPAAAVPGTPVLSVVPGNGRTREQNEEIRAFFTPFLQRDGVRAVYDAVLIDPAVTMEKARAQLLAKLGEDATPATPQGAHPRVEMGASEADKFRDAASMSILARADRKLLSPKERETLGQNPYRGHKLLDVARAALDRINFNTRGLNQMEIVAAAFTQSTSDFPVLLENVMHKALQAAYGTTPDTWTSFCSVGSVSDFRASNRYRLGSFGNLDALTELGEFRNKSIPDGEKASITAGTKGNIINLSRAAIINDDLGAFVGLAAGLGRAGRRTIEVDVYALLAQNSGAGPTMTDGNALFHSAHGNLAGSGAVPSVTTVIAGRNAIKAQKDVSGNDYLDLMPDVFLGNQGNADTAQVLNDALYDPTVTNKFQVPNLCKGLFTRTVGSPRIATTYWYMFAAPSVAPTIEVAFLDGNQEPYIELEQGFDVDGARYKVRLDYGTAVIDYRGAYANPGA